MKSIQVYGEMHRYIPLLAKHAGYRAIGEYVVQHSARKYGKTKFGTDRFIKGFLDLITLLFVQRFGKRPMLFFGLIGYLMLVMEVSALHCIWGLTNSIWKPKDALLPIDLNFICL